MPLNSSQRRRVPRLKPFRHRARNLGLGYLRGVIGKELDDLRHPPIQSRSKRLVERIIDVSARILADGSRGLLTTNAVAREAGISVGSLYRYFPNKEALILAVIEREGRQFQEHIRRLSGDVQSGDLAEHAGRVVTATVSAYRSIAADGSLLAMELRRPGVVDRRTAAFSAITDVLESVRAAQSSIDAPLGNDTTAIMAEIIVSLVDAAMTRPTAALSAHNVERAATGAAVAYLNASQDMSIFTNLGPEQN